MDALINVIWIPSYALDRHRIAETTLNKSELYFYNGFDFSWHSMMEKEKKGEGKNEEKILKDSRGEAMEKKS